MSLSEDIRAALFGELARLKTGGKLTVPVEDLSNRLALILEAKLAKKYAFDLRDPDIEERIEASGLLSARSGEALVALKWAGRMAQMTTEEARQHALNVLAVAESAEMDRTVVQWAMHRFGMQPDQAAQILDDFRSMRLTGQS